MSRDYEPEPGQWYEDLDREDTFRVLTVDPDEALVRIQWLDGEVEEIDLDEWNELDLDLTQEPEGWVDEGEDLEDEDLDEDDWDDEEADEDDDWDDDEDYDDEDDEYHDRE